MISNIEQLMNIDWKVGIIFVLLAIILIPQLKDAWRKFCEAIGYESKAARKEREHEEQMRELFKKQEEYHQQSIQIRNGLDENQKLLEKNQEEIREDLSKLLETFNTYIQKDNERTVAMLRNSLWRNHRDFMAQGYITPEGLKTFTELGKVYEAAGGDDIFHDRLKPDVESLEIKYE